jgi:hypothetical protein
LQSPDRSASQVSWWSAEGNGLDSADANHGTLQGGVTFENGVCGQTFSLDGIDDHVRVADAANLDGMSQLSLEAWARFDSTPNGKWQWIISKGSAVGFGSNSYSVWLADDNLKIQAAVESSTGLNTVAAPDVITPGRFYHVATTYDGVAIRLYLDGALRGTGGLSGAVRNTFFPVFIGRRSGFGVDGRGDVIAGDLDEVRIYNRALSPGEIAIEFARGSTQMLIARVAGLDLNHGNRNALTVKLQAAQRALAEGDVDAAIDSLDAFVNQLEAFRRSGKLNEETADALISAGQLIISRLSGS